MITLKGGEGVLQLFTSLRATFRAVGMQLRRTLSALLRTALNSAYDFAPRQLGPKFPDVGE